MSTQLSKILIDSVEEVERNDGTGTFPVVKVTGITFSVSESGNSSFTKRKVSLPLNQMTSKAEAELYFKAGTILEGFELYKKPSEEYQYEAPTGEIYSLNYKWAIRKIDQEDPIAKRQEKPMEKEVFSTARNTNNLQPQH
tara:strand:- start:31855 stop:32274 length:420 start_codon:yes stop_codon:yes gene_type:complete